MPKPTVDSLMRDAGMTREQAERTIQALEERAERAQPRAPEPEGLSPFETASPVSKPAMPSTPPKEDKIPQAEGRTVVRSDEIEAIEKQMAEYARLRAVELRQDAQGPTRSDREIARLVADEMRKMEYDGGVEIPAFILDAHEAKGDKIRDTPSKVYVRAVFPRVYEYESAASLGGPEGRIKTQRETDVQYEEMLDTKSLAESIKSLTRVATPLEFEDEAEPGSAIGEVTRDTVGALRVKSWEDFTESPTKMFLPAYNMAATLVTHPRLGEAAQEVAAAFEPVPVTKLGSYQRAQLRTGEDPYFNRLPLQGTVKALTGEDVQLPAGVVNTFNWLEGRLEPLNTLGVAVAGGGDTKVERERARMVREGRKSEAIMEALPFIESENPDDIDVVLSSLPLQNYHSKMWAKRPTVREVVDAGRAEGDKASEEVKALIERYDDLRGSPIERGITSLTDAEINDELWDRFSQDATVVELPQALQASAITSESLKRGAKEYRRDYEDTGGRAVDAIERTLMSASVKGKTESGIGWFMRVPGSAIPLLYEESMAPGSPASIDYMIGNDLVVPVPWVPGGVTIAQAIPGYVPVRDFSNSSWMSRVVARLESGNAGFQIGYADIARQLGQKEGDLGYDLAENAGVALDWLMPLDDAAVGGVGSAYRRAKRGESFARSMRGFGAGASIKAGLGGMVPEAFDPAVTHAAREMRPIDLLRALAVEDPVAVLALNVREATDRAAVRGVNPLEAMPRSWREPVESRIRIATGLNQAEVRNLLDGYGERVVQARKAHLDNWREVLDATDPETVALRATPEYQAHAVVLDALETANLVTRPQREMLQAFEEVVANQRVARGEIATPQEHFAEVVLRDRLGQTRTAPGMGGFAEWGEPKQRGEPRMKDSAEAEAVVRREFGKDTENLLTVGRLHVVDNVADIEAIRTKAGLESKGEMPDDIKGVWIGEDGTAVPLNERPRDPLAKGTAYLVARNTTEREVFGVVLHEVGVHAGMREMVGERFDALTKRAMELKDQKSETGRQVRQHLALVEKDNAPLPKDRLDAILREEALAYLVEFQPKHSIVRRLLARLRAWLEVRFKGAAWLPKLTDADLQALALASLRRQNRAVLGGALTGGDAGAAMFSRADVAGADSPADIEAARNAWVEQGTDSPWFKRWSGNLPAVDAGDPLPDSGFVVKAYHRGTFDPTVDDTFAPGGGGVHFGTESAADERPVGKYLDDLILGIEVEEEGGRWFWHLNDGTDSWDLRGEDGFDSADDARVDAEEAAVDGADNYDWDQSDWPMTESYVRIRNPKRMPDQGADWTKAVAQAKAEGHDGIVYRNKFEDPGSLSYIAFNPEQIKSVDNRGTFSTEDARHMYSRRVEDVPKPEMPEPTAEVRRKYRDLTMAAIIHRKGDALDEMRSYAAKHPEAKAWRDYNYAVADAELLQRQDDARAEWEAGEPARQAEAQAKTDRYQAAKEGGPRLPKEEAAENFARWFGDSVITKDGEPGGKPLKVTHETGAKFDRFAAGEFGFHFGVSIPVGMFGWGRRLTGHLAIDNPMRMRDLGVWTPEAVLAHGPFSDAERAALLVDVERIRAENDAPTGAMVKKARASGDTATADRWEKMISGDYDGDDVFKDRRANYLASKPVHDALKEKGYDGIVYANDAEGRGDSYIAFEPSQFKSTRNVGTFDWADPRFMYSRRATEKDPFDDFPDDLGPIHWSMPLDEVEAVAVDLPTEHAVVFAGEAQVGRIAGNNMPADIQELVRKAGATLPENYVYIPPDIMDRLRDTPDLVFTHNHPSGYGISPEDVVIAAAIDAREMRAVTPLGVWVLRAPEGGWPETLHFASDGKYPTGLLDFRSSMLRLDALIGGEAVPLMDDWLHANGRSDAIATSKVNDEPALWARYQSIVDEIRLPRYQERIDAHAPGARLELIAGRPARPDARPGAAADVPGATARDPEEDAAAAVEVEEVESKFSRRAEPAPVWYSALRRAVETLKQDRFPPEQLRGMLAKAPGVKADEVKWTRLEEFLAGKKTVTKAEVLAWLDENKVELGEVLLGSPSSALAERHNVDPAKMVQAIEDAHEFKRKVKKDAGRAAEAGADAVAALEEDPSNLSGAQDLLSTARRYEVEYGDSPAWGPVERLLEELTEGAEERAHEAEDVSGDLVDAALSPEEIEQLRQAVTGASGAWTDLAWSENIDVETLDGNYVSIDIDTLTEDGAGTPADGPSEYDRYQLPGGENYRELLFKMPQELMRRMAREGTDQQIAHLERRVEEGVSVWRTGGVWPPGHMEAQRELAKMRDYRSNPVPYRSPHFQASGEGQNLLAHVRFNDRVGPNGEKILHIEEVQSDWHQAGREEGYRGDRGSKDQWTATVADRQGQWNVVDGNGEAMGKYIAMTAGEAVDDAWYHAVAKRVPDAPFAKTWHEMAIKRMLRWAAENDYDSVTWTTGIQQVKRYEDQVRQVVDEIRWRKADGSDDIIIEAVKDGRVVHNDAKPAAEMKGVIGGEMVARIDASPDQSGTLTGSDLTVGGEGMKGFYDKMIPQWLDKYVAKWGGKVEKGDIGLTRDVPTEDFEVFRTLTGREVARFPSETEARAYVEAQQDGGVAGLDWRQDRREADPVHLFRLTPEMKRAVVEQGQPLFSRRVQDDTPNLVVQHNLAAGNLLHVDELGAIAVPSLAVSPVHDPLMNFGEITLLGRADLADPKRGVPVYDADVYTPRHPRAEHEVNQKALDKVVRETDAYATRTGDKYNVDDPLRRAAADDREMMAAENLSAMRLRYLEEVLGQTIEIPTKGPDLAFPDLAAIPAVREVYDAINVRDWYGGDFDKKQAIRAAVEPVVRQAIEDIAAEKAVNVPPATREKFIARRRDTLTKTWFADDGTIMETRLDQMVHDASELQKARVVPDHVKARDLTEAAVDKAGIDEYRAWVRTQVEPLRGKQTFRTESGTRKPYTLDNIVRAMTRTIRAGEGFDYKLPSARAKGAKRYKSLDQMKADRARAVGQGQFEAVDKKAIEEEFNALAADLGAYAKGRDSKYSYERTSPWETLPDALGESYRPGHSLRKELTYGFDSLPPEVYQRVADFAEKLRTYTTGYFEAKPQRAVALSEFVGAAVPDNLDAKARAVLDKNGLDVAEYKNGDPEDRKRVIAEVAGKHGLLFSRRAFENLEFGPEWRDGVYDEAITPAQRRATTTPGGMDEWPSVEMTELTEPKRWRSPSPVKAGPVEDTLPIPGFHPDTGGGATEVLARRGDTVSERTREMFSRRAEETPEFKAWFEGSAVVDDKGEPLTVYHGTDVPDIEAFSFERPKLGNIWGQGFYFTESVKDAQHWARTADRVGYGGSQTVMPVYLSIKKPLDIAEPDHKFATWLREWYDNKLPEEVDAWLNGEQMDGSDAEMYLGDWMGRHLRTLAKKAGYDGIVGDYKGERHWVAFEPNQIKNTTNERPTADPRLDFSRRAGQVTGTYTPPQVIGQHLIQLFAGADFGTLLHENGHLLTQLAGADTLRVLAEHFDSIPAAEAQVIRDRLRSENPDVIAQSLGYTYEWHDRIGGVHVEPDITVIEGARGAAPGDRVLTRRGHERAAESMRRYAELRMLPTGPVGQAIAAAGEGVRNLWLRARGRELELPTAVRERWDRVLRPDVLAELLSIRVADPTTVGERTFPSVTIPERQAGLVEEQPVRVAGTRREAAKVTQRPEEVLQALGLRPFDEVGINDLVARAIADVAAEKARTMTPYSGPMVTLTARTRVRKDLVPSIRRRARQNLDGALGMSLDRLVSTQREGDAAVRLEPAQQAGLRTLVFSLAEEPITTINGRSLIPESLTRGSLDVVTFDDINTIQEMAIDVAAGAGSRRNRRAEAIPPSVGVAVFKFFTGLPDRLASSKATHTLGTSLASVQQKLSNDFIVKRPMEGYADPHIQEIMERGFRRMGLVGEWFRNLAKSIHRARSAMQRWGFAANAGMVMETIRGISRELTPPVADRHGDVSVVDDLLDVSRAYPGVQPIDRLLDPVELRRIQAVLVRWRYGMNAHETAAMRILHSYSGRHPSTLTAPELADVEDALHQVVVGVEDRKKLVLERATEIATMLAGSKTKGIAITMTEAEFFEVYKAFYDGRWMPEDVPTDSPSARQFNLQDHLATRGRETGRGDQPSRIDYEPNVAFAEMVLRMRAREIAADVADELAAYGLLDVQVPEGAHRDTFTENVAKYLNLITEWNESILYDEATDGRYRLPPAPPHNPDVPNFAFSPEPGRFHDFAAYEAAQRMLERWGWNTAGKWVEVNIEGRRVVVPEMFQEAWTGALDDAAKMGTAFGSARVDVATGRLGFDTPIDALQRAWNFLVVGSARRIKQGMIPGLLLPNISTWVGNAMGGHLQWFQAEGVGSVFGSYLRPNQYRLVTGVVARLWGDGRQIPNGGVLVTKSGRIYSADQITTLAKEHGLDSSMVKAEIAQPLIEDIRKMHRPWWQRLGVPLEWWQGQIQNAYTAIDNWVRTQVFIDNLRQGADPSHAAERARLAAYDYGRLTDFEKKVGRRISLFYAFERANQTLFWWTVLNHPSRVLGQLRLIRDLQRDWLEEEPNLVIPDWDRELFMVWYRNLLSVADAKAQGVKIGSNPASVEGYAWVSKPLPVVDGMMLWADILRILAGRGGPTTKAGAAAIAGRVPPWFQAPFVYATESDIFYGRDLRSVKRYNQIPAWFAAEDIALTGGTVLALVDARPVRQADPADWESPDDAYVWEVGPSENNRMAWWMFRNLGSGVPGMGRSIDTLATLDRSWYNSRGPVELLVGATQETRLAVADRTGLVDMPIDHPHVDEDRLAGPRPGLTEAEEFRAFWGLRPTTIYTLPTLYGRSHQSTRRGLETKVKEMKKESGE